MAQNVCHTLQEMEHILEHIQSSRLDANTETDDFDQQDIQQPTSGTASGADPSDADEAEDPRQEQQPLWGKKQKRMQTMVFSATLTLPQHLRKRLHKSALSHPPCIGLAPDPGKSPTVVHMVSPYWLD